MGRAISLKLAKDGTAVSVWDRNLQGAEETVAMIRELEGTATAFGGDASSADDIAAAVQHTHTTLGTITILVNNAALSPFSSFEDITEEIWDQLMALNLKGPFLCCKAIIPDMLAAGWARHDMAADLAKWGAA